MFKIIVCLIPLLLLFQSHIQAVTPTATSSVSWKIAVLIYKNAELDFPGTEVPITNWQAQYFNNMDLSGNPALTRIDEKIDFNWNDQKPFDEINKENFSARWTSSFNLPETKDLYFDAEVDDGVRVYLDDNPVINQWQDQTNHFYRIANVSAGNHNIRVEYYQHLGGSNIRFFIAEAKHASFHMTDEEIQRTKDNIAKIPIKIFNWSNNAVSLSYDLNLIDRPMTTEGNPAKKGWWWASPVSTAPELNTLSDYDSVFVLWPSRTSDDFCKFIESCGGGWGLKPSSWTRGMTYGVQQGIMGEQPDSENLLIHEWLHGVTGFFSDRGFNPQPDIDGAENKYGYKKDNDPEWSLFYADVVKKKVLDPQSGNYIGIDQTTWLSGKPSSVFNEICLNGELGNLNCDTQGLINDLDLNILLTSWATASNTASPPPNGQHSADLNEDKMVDEADLNILLKNWKTSQINEPLIFFPVDHAQHLSFRSEWWYLNLLARTSVNGAQQKDLAYVISFSRLLNNNGLLSSRYDNSNQSFEQSTKTGGQLSGVLKNNLLYVSYVSDTENLTLEELAPAVNGAKQYSLTGSTPQVGTFNLLLKERTVNPEYPTNPLLWGCTGRISVFSLNDTYYYSQPDLDISGTIEDIDGTIRQVTAGKSWLDHQWFNSAPPSDWKGHYWASFYYTKSSSVYNPGSHSGIGWVTQIYNSGPKYSYWVMRNFDGSNSCGEGGTVGVLANDPVSRFPIKLGIDLSSPGLAIPTFNSFSANQVFTTPIGTFIEAASFVNGIAEQGYTGLGFFETGIKN